MHHVRHVSVLLFACLALSSPQLLAAAAAGKLTFARGEVTAVKPDGTTRSLHKDSPIFAGERINTGRRSLALMRFADGTRFALGQRSAMTVDQFVRTGKPEEDRLSARIIKGAFRFVSGLIARARPQSMQVRVGVVATIGVRGTHVGGEVDESGESARVVLLEPEDPSHGNAITVANEFGSVDIDEPGYGTEIPDAHSPPSPPRRMRLRTVQNLMRSLQSIQRMSVPRPRPMH